MRELQVFALADSRERQEMQFSDPAPMAFDGAPAARSLLWGLVQTIRLGNDGCWVIDTSKEYGCRQQTRKDMGAQRVTPGISLQNALEVI
jgi:hypothetical protein